MYYAPSRPIEIEKFPKGYIKPTGQNLEFLQRPPEDNRRIEDYYGKAQDQQVYNERPQNKEKANMNKDQEQRDLEQQQFLQERQQETKQKDNQNNQSNINIQSAITAQRFENAPFNPIFTNNIYNTVGASENITQSIVQPQEQRIGISSLRGPQSGYVHGLRGFSQDFQEPGLFVQDFRDIGSQGFELAHPEYRRMAPPGILSEYRRGIPEAIFQRRNYWKEGRRDFGYRVFPIRDYEKIPRIVDYSREPVVLNQRTILPQDYERAAYLSSERQRYEPYYEMHQDPRAVPIPDYYVPEYGRYSGIWREREFKERMNGYRNQGNQQEWIYPSSYGKIRQQMQRVGIQDNQNQEERRY